MKRLVLAGLIGGVVLSLVGLDHLSHVDPGEPATVSVVAPSGRDHVEVSLPTVAPSTTIRAAGVASDRAAGLERMRAARRERREREVAPVLDQLATLRDELVKDPAAKDRIVSQYSVAASSLPEPYRIEAMSKLEAVH